MVKLKAAELQPKMKALGLMVRSKVEDSSCDLEAKAVAKVVRLMANYLLLGEKAD